MLDIGLDIGSTTVKAVVVDADGAILWKRYERHNTRQAHLLRDFLQVIEERFSGHDFRVFITGSGGRAIAPFLHATYVQEVNAVTCAVEQRFPDTGSVLELGGQDAKVIIWKEDTQGNRSTITYMNDKCAGGTGATLDRILNKIGIGQDDVSSIRAAGKTVHHIAAKCGVFAETDVVGLLKSGVHHEELVVSLCTAIAKQNLEVLVRGNVLRDKVLLLGGPHRYIPVLAEIWRTQIPLTWEMHHWKPADLPLEELIRVPPDAEYFAAIGSVLFGVESRRLLAQLESEPSHEELYPGLDKLEAFITEGRMTRLLSSGAVRDGLARNEEEVRQFADAYALPPFEAPALERGATPTVFLGVDGGSTSSKLVLLDSDNTVLYRDYILSQGNPVHDLREMFARMHAWSAQQGVHPVIAATAVTGYASDILKAAFEFDHMVVETIAHMRSATTFYGDVDVICDVGGQDIKVLFLKHGRVVDFKLNTQCSAGNGYFLQSMADQFGVPIDQYAARAFSASKAPAFNYGCAVFMEQDRVNFQQLGWTNEEIMAGLALVLPLNIWNYVVQEPHIARFGNRIVLQGGTQKNLAAVKAQVDYITCRVPGAKVYVHRYADLCGAIGAAIEAREQQNDRPAVFIGVEAASRLTLQTRNDDSTRCRFCGNRCRRTFVDIRAPGRAPVLFISGNGCEKGLATDLEAMRSNEARERDVREKHPNLVAQAAVEVFDEYPFEPLPEQGATVSDSYVPRSVQDTHRGPRAFQRSCADSLERRRQMTVGIPRLLNMYQCTPFFSTYLRAVGIGGIVYSDFTSPALWDEGNKWGAIDPCFPAKVGPAHIYNILMHKTVTHICFPRVTHLQSDVSDTLANTACAIQMGTPEVVEAAFMKDRNLLEEKNVVFWKPLLSLDRPLDTCGLMFDYFEERLGITWDENCWAVCQGYAAMEQYYERLRTRGRAILNDLIDQDRIGILAIGHPYHHDPGLNHGILEEFQRRGFPILCVESLPVDEEFLRPLFGADAEAEGMLDSRRINDVWHRNFNRNTNHKIWAAKVAARHPNLAVVDLSSFKCGHDAPTYSYIDTILDASATPHFLFHDLDQNKPRASLKIRIQTIEYFLRLEETKLKTLVGIRA
jgi:predicted CoA-substrate-specific enzyme activase